MRVLLVAFCMLGVASAQFNAYYNKNNKDGAQYDENSNRDAPIRLSRPVKKVANRRNNRPTDYTPVAEAYKQPLEIQQTRATDRQGYVYNPVQQKQAQRQLRPVQKKQPEYQEEVPRFQEESRFEPARYNAPKEYAPRPVYPAPAKKSAPVPSYQPKPQEYDYGRKPVKALTRPVEPVYQQEPSIDQLNEVYVEPEIVENRYREPEPQRQKVFERNADVVVDDRADQLEGESFQPAYTPYSPPPAAYDSAYVPVEQKSIEAAVAAGAAAYPGEGYNDAQRLSFQIHGQEGPHSYRFGYDTGVGYNRQFRYEERDQYGVLHGRYGYYDQAGKLQVVNYTADPQNGFHADGEHVPKPQY